MKPRYLLDTDICVFIRGSRQPRLTERFRALSPGEAAISIITYGELAFGVGKSTQRAQASVALRTLLQFLPVLPLPVEAGAAYGKIRSELQGRGEVIGGNDLWIAAHAVASQLILITNNEREFRRVSGLAVENWAGRTSESS